MKPYQQGTQGGAPWSATDITQIENAVRDETEFTQICALFPSRTAEAVRHRVHLACRTIDAANAQANPQPVNVQLTPQPVSIRANRQPTPGITTQTPIQYAKAGQVWTAQEVQTLDSAVQNGFDFAHIRTLFPDRPVEGVKRRYQRSTQEASSTSMSKPKSKPKRQLQIVPWTVVQEQKIRDALRAKVNRDTIRKMFPRRSADAVRQKIGRISMTLGEEKPEPAPLSTGRVQASNGADSAYEDADMDMYAEPLEPEDGDQPDKPESELPQLQAIRSSSPEEIDVDHVIGPIPEDEEFVMSGALPVPNPVAVSDASPVHSHSRSSDSPRSVRSWKVQDVDVLPRSSTPPRPDTEPLTPRLRAQELPTIGNREPTGDYFGDYFSFESPVENIDRTAFRNPFEASWLQTQDNGWDLDSGLDPEARAWLNGEPWSPPNNFSENRSAGNVGQKCHHHHPVLPQDSLAHDNFAAPISPFMMVPERHEAVCVNNGHATFECGFCMNNHPDVHDGIDSAPVPHQPVAPADSRTLEQVFADPSVPPSAFLPSSAAETSPAALLASLGNHRNQWMNYDADVDIVMEEETETSGYDVVE
ncbi:uncharacterized protein CC84DRAFT_794531 [Paraphaeosphaeria sporulosa]|uniref:Myb-like domain-containing protein n=1 Tax=Paraphaeosphaeria sporulosa TaxID=1460663 RepID=A0A177CCH9_9PLEO|nr:uncharacterized protein CC84DRAFT_794531 [Paraphaeosphaeria sporulosa]OAG04509.1 hypothetical protein CC84DRAFT_794531 [Paraphaeosphaeria sporulosa]